MAAGATYLITGATSGIGHAAAEQIAAVAPPGSTLVLAGRDPTRTEASVAAVRAAAAAQVEVQSVMADLSSLDDVRRLASEMHERVDHLDVLVNNAGLVMGQRRLTVDGLEWTLAVNHLAPFLLTHQLLDLLGAAPAPRVVTTASAASALGRIDLDDLMYSRRRYTQFRAYCSSKLANVLFAAEAARRWPDVWSVSAHPGAVNTRFGNEGGRLLRHGIAWGGRWVLRTPAQGATVLTWAAQSPDACPPAVPSGSYVADGKVGTPPRRGRDKVLAAALWEESLRLTALA